MLLDFKFVVNVVRRRVKVNKGFYCTEKPPLQG